MKKFRWNDKRILLAAGLVILVFLMMDFNNRVSTLVRLSGQKSDISTQVAVLKQTEQALRTQIAYATSDVAVEEWAREQGRLIQPGDHPVIPIASTNSTPVVGSLPEPTIQPPENWEIWRALFLGNK